MFTLLQRVHSVHHSSNMSAVISIIHVQKLAEDRWNFSILSHTTNTLRKQECHGSATVGPAHHKQQNVSLLTLSFNGDVRILSLLMCSEEKEDNFNINCAPNLWRASARDSLKSLKAFSVQTCFFFHFKSVNSLLMQFE